MMMRWYAMAGKIGVLATAALFGGCCMMLDDSEPPKINEIVEKHKLEINRDKELDLLCGKAWVPIYIKGQEGVDGKNAIELPPELQAYIEFQRDGQVNGFAGVNSFSGSFAVTAPNLLRFGALATTLMAGPHLDYEMLFMAQINEVANFSIQPDGVLELRKRSMLMLRCKPVPLSAVKRAAQSAKPTTPKPPEPATKIAPKADNTSLDKSAAPVNPALPTVEKAPEVKAEATAARNAASASSAPVKKSAK